MLRSSSATGHAGAVISGYGDKHRRALHTRAFLLNVENI